MFDGERMGGGVGEGEGGNPSNGLYRYVLPQSVRVFRLPFLL